MRNKRVFLQNPIIYVKQGRFTLFEDWGTTLKVLSLYFLPIVNKYCEGKE